MTFYGLKTCDTCRKALAELAAAGHEVQVLDIRSDGIPRTVLENLVAEVGPDVLVNRRSTTWRSLDDTERARAMNPAMTALVLAAHPTLMKRPVIVSPDATHVGWSASVRTAVLG